MNIKFDNTELESIYEFHKWKMQDRLIQLDNISKDIKQLEINLKKIAVPHIKFQIEEGMDLIWDGKRIKMNDKNLIECSSLIRLKTAEHFCDFLKFCLI